MQNNDILTLNSSKQFFYVVASVEWNLYEIASTPTQT